MKNNKTKVITIAALIIAIIALSIGFAAFASTLNISTGASVTPTDNFSVKFSKEDTSLVENQSVLPTQASTASGDGATINNNDNPTITGLSASFNGPGQKVEYIFYVRNMGPYDAYLTDVRFNNADGGTSFKKCEATGSNPVSNANDMCEYITFKLELAGLATPLTSTLDISSVIGNNYVVNKSLTPESGNTNSKLVKVTIEYPNGSPYADGSFNVAFGSVEMVFATLAGYIPPVQEATSDTENTCVVKNNKSFGSTCTYTDLDSSGSITLGDKVTCGTEGFYVIETPVSDTVKMLAEWNLNVSEPGDIVEGVPFSYIYCESTPGYQDIHVRGYLDTETHPELMEYTFLLTIEGMLENYPWPYGLVRFDRVTTGEYGYWAPGGSLNTSTYTENNNGGYPAYVYDNNATLKTFVDTYAGYLNSQVSGANAQGRLINIAELEALGCSMNGETCESSPSWVYQTSYWSGSAYGQNRIWAVESNADMINSDFNYGDTFGVRPVIEISSSVIQAS